MKMTMTYFFSILLIMFSCKASKNGPGPDPNPGPNPIPPVTNFSNPLSPMGKPGPPITLANNNQSDYYILLPAAASSQEQFAAEELRNYIQQISGVNLDIIQERGNSMPNKHLSVGRTRALEISNISEQNNNLGEDGYGIFQNENNLYFFGGIRRGPITAVYSFLEEDLGCRWYGAKPETWHIPSASTISFSPVSRQSVAAFKVRDIFYRDAVGKNYILQNKTVPMWHIDRVAENTGKLKVYPNGWSVHTFPKLVPSSVHFDAHPDWFALDARSGKRNKNGQLCLTEQPVFDLSLEKVRKILRKNPQASYISVSQRDGKNLTCSCSDCETINTAEGALSGTLIRFVNYIGENIEQEFPNVKITTLAYRETYKAPRTAPRHNVYVRLCADSHSWGKPYLDASKTPNFIRAIQDWSNLTDNLLIWEYPVIYKEYLLPHPNMKTVAENLKIYRDNGVVGVKLQGNVSNWSIERSTLRSWVWSKLLWNPDLDPQALIADFSNGYYQEAAEPMLRYHQLLWQKKEDLPNERNDTRAILGASFYDQAKTLFDEAYSIARDPETINRINVERVPLLYYKLTLGPSSAAEKPHCLEVLNDFTALSKKYGMTRIAETVKDTEEFLIVSRAKIDNYGVKSTIPEGSFYAEEKQLKIARHYKDKSIVPSIIKDPNAQNGLAVSVPTGHSAWVVQWEFENLPLVPGNKYKIRIRSRIQNSGNGGNAFSFGVYDLELRENVFKKSAPISSLIGSYKTIESPPFYANKNHKFFLAPNKNPDMLNIIVDRVELIPVSF